MKFHHLDGAIPIKRRLRWLPWTLAAVCFVTGMYVLAVALAPQITLPYIDNEVADRVAKLIKQTEPKNDGDRLYIPRINIDVPIAAGDASVLERGAWHRVPQNGDPEKGGNFVLSAHRFEMGLTLQQTRQKSPFYHIEKLSEGDQVFVDYHGKRYAYAVSRRYEVPRTATEIEAASQKPKLTLYSCGLRGEKAGRYVIEASPLGEVVGLR